MVCKFCGQSEVWFQYGPVEEEGRQAPAKETGR